MRILAWPFIMAWGLIGLIFSAIGRVLSFCLGTVFVALGVLLCISVVGIVIGAPLTAFGVALMFKTVF